MLKMNQYIKIIYLPRVWFLLGETLIMFPNLKVSFEDKYMICECLCQVLIWSYNPELGNWKPMRATVKTSNLNNVQWQWGKPAELLMNLKKAVGKKASRQYKSFLSPCYVSRLCFLQENISSQFLLSFSTVIYHLFV